MLRTRLTERFRLDHPIISAPMGWVAGGRLAAAVSAAGGLGLIGGGYGDEAWLREQIEAAGDARIGYGLITFTLVDKPHLLDIVLDRAPTAIFLSFGDPEPFAARIRAARVPLICQIQTVRDARRALDVGADVVVAQGAEAGGHGEKRATFTLVPEVADLIAATSHQTLLCAAGGIADGRGLAAALVLGADGVVVGTRFWASDEALVHPNQQAAVVSATGDDTIRSDVVDIVKGYDIWPQRYNLRTLRSVVTDRWHGRAAELRTVADGEAARFAEAAARGDATYVGATVGEAIGLIQEIAPAGAILKTMAAEAEDILRGTASRG